MFSNRALLPPQTENKRAAEVLALGEIYSAFSGVAVARRVLAEGGGVREFHKHVTDNVRQGGDFDRAMGLDLTAQDLHRYSLVDAALGRKGLEQEVANEIYQKSGIINPGRGLAVPWTIFSRDFTVGTAAEAGNLNESGARPIEYLRDPLRAALAFGRLGAIVTPGFRGDFSIPKFNSDTAAEFVAETAGLSESQPGSGLVSFVAKRVGGYVEVSKMALIQGGPYMETWLTRCLRGIAMAQLEAGAINGSGIGNNPLGVRATPSVQTVVGGTNGALFDWGHLTDLENKAGLANADDTPWGGYLTNTSVRKRCKTTQRATGLPFIWDNTDTPLNGYRAAITSNVPSNLTKGSSSGVCSSVMYSADWSACLVPIFGAPDIVVDHASLAASGLVRIIINIWMASGLLHPEIFSVMDDALTS